MTRVTRITQRMIIEDQILQGVLGVHLGVNPIRRGCIIYPLQRVLDLSDRQGLDTDLLRWIVKVLVTPRRVKGISDLFRQKTSYYQNFFAERNIQAEVLPITRVSYQKVLVDHIIGIKSIGQGAEKAPELIVMVLPPEETADLGI